MSSESKTSAVLGALALAFVALAAGFCFNFQARPVQLRPIRLVDTNFLDTATVRRSYADLVRAGEDLSDFDCYACHERGKAPPLRFDAAHNLIVPKEHADIVMGHGRHGRNNNCFNCHNETNLDLLQTRDGREVKFADSPALCGSCHGPTYRDWEAGAHGRITGYWDRALGEFERKACVNCHNPHSPRFPGRSPAPGPHPLHAQSLPSSESPEVSRSNAPAVPGNTDEDWMSAAGEGARGTKAAGDYGRLSGEPCDEPGPDLPASLEPPWETWRALEKGTNGSWTAREYPASSRILQDLARTGARLAERPNSLSPTGGEGRGEGEWLINTNAAREDPASSRSGGTPPREDAGPGESGSAPTHAPAY